MENILITGCSTGIGFETAKVLKNHEFKVYATARKEKDVEILKKLGFISYKLDITKPENIKDILDKILKEDGKLSAVFNNAGYGQPGAVEDVKTEVLKEQFETNLFGLHEMTIQTMKIFRKQGFGKIIQHSSVLGIISLKFRGAYNSSKYAIEGLTDTLRQELIGSNISVSLINTGPVTSKFRENALKMFNKNIIIEDSFFESTYKNEVKKRLESTDDTKAPFNLPATSVANVVLKIMNSKKPKPRYYVTKATHILGFAKRVLSTNLLDKLLNRV
ncbi:short-chain dehydrogenase [Malaciobacter marinus]|uniref:SDR family NAD(P)-dependent oxidoreductase n=1 Tax=Malaciobacter marinus TaxID=505249 RepID=UPI000C08593B|nr:SDR family NAD(P)-dependent oxidoreductase [Malaciobacter marinus]PHO12232.1 short-chain dehydrogenase [Malaciobacter marinus]